MINNLSSIIDRLKNRRGMYIFDNSYNSLASFLIGYISAINDYNSDINISNEFRNWLHKREGIHTSLHWSAYILNECAKKNEEKACQILIELLYEFCQEKKEKII